MSCSSPYPVLVPPTETAANLLRSVRHAQGCSLRTAAADIGVAPSQLSRIERGQRGMSKGMPERFASYYGVPAEVIALTQGEVPADIVRILQEHPEAIDLLREGFGAGR